MNKYDKSDMSVNSVSEDVTSDNSQSGSQLSENNNKISIINAIFSCIIYISINTLAGRDVGNEPTDSIIHWGNLIAYLMFAALLFYVLKTLSSFSFEIFKNITLKNIAIAVLCVILAYSVNYALNLAVLQNIFKSSYNYVMTGQRSLKPLPVLFHICLTGPICEELLFRGYILKGLRNKHGKEVALFVSSVLFAVSHWNIIQAANTFIIGIIFGALYIKKRSVFSCIFAHILYSSIAMYHTYYLSLF